MKIPVRDCSTEYSFTISMLPIENAVEEIKPEALYKSEFE